MKFNLTIPDSLNEVTLRQYQEFLKVEEPTEVDVLREFLFLTDGVIKKLSKVQVDMVAASIMKMFEASPPHIPTFTLNGIKYGFIPKLDEISWGENADITEFMGDWQKMHLAMSVLYRPIETQRKDKYIIKDYEGVTSDLIDMPLGVALGAVVFFYNLTNDLLNCIPNYLAEQLPKEVLAMDSTKSGGSTTKSTRSVKEMLDDLTRLLDYPYTSAIYTSPLSAKKQSTK